MILASQCPIMYFPSAVPFRHVSRAHWITQRTTLDGEYSIVYFSIRGPLPQCIRSTLDYALHNPGQPMPHRAFLHPRFSSAGHFYTLDLAS